MTKTELLFLIAAWATLLLAILGIFLKTESRLTALETKLNFLLQRRRADRMIKNTDLSKQ